MSCSRTEPSLRETNSRLAGFFSEHRRYPLNLFIPSQTRRAPPGSTWRILASTSTRAPTIAPPRIMSLRRYVQHLRRAPPTAREWRWRRRPNRGLTARSRARLGATRSVIRYGLDAIEYRIENDYYLLIYLKLAECDANWRTGDPAICPWIEFCFMMCARCRRMRLRLAVVATLGANDGSLSGPTPVRFYLWSCILFRKLLY
ncbi:hypothetical protein EVAR_41828_1 [Eumeta japonica]|uniref:Uncharacterized protein n=1 Tax=Eumeta variegata TaxID=151549 RepID=A0A4C1X8K3_EUMVA|nr:hypothetical protein EVAR_41828_1 [Eumeta japonica]